MRSITIPGYPDYEAREDGSIFSRRAGRCLTSLAVPNGYRHVVLGRKRVSVHRVVAITYFGGIPKGFVVHHKNGIKHDNRVENLEVLSQSENVKRAYRDGLRVISDDHKARCARLGSSKRSLSEEEVAELRASYDGKRGSQAKISRKYGLNHKTVRSILLGHTYRSVKK